MAGIAWLLVAFLLAKTASADIIPSFRKPVQPKTPSEDSYFVSAPKQITRGSTYGLSVDILNGTDVTVTATLMESVYNGTTRRNDLVNLKKVTGLFKRGITGSLEIPIEDDFNCRNCKLSIKGRGSLVFERTKNVRIKSLLLSKFIQTDKAIYKPGQRVRYRVFAVYPNLQVYKGSFTIKIKDPANNKIVVNKGLLDQSGVVEGFLNLSDEPPFGDWTIEMTVEDVLEYETQVFTVAQYELPRFEITVDLPPYSLLHETSISGTVKAMYTFGKPVKGMVDLHVGPNQGPDNCGKMPTSVNIGFSIDGEAKFSIPKSSIQRVMSVYHKTAVRFTAFVTETATGVKLNGSNTITYHTKEYSIDFMSNTPAVFKPGLPYTAYVQIKAPDGLPPPDRHSVMVYPYATYYVNVPDQSKYGITAFTGTYALEKMQHSVPVNGIVPIHMSIPNNATNINIQVFYKDISTSKSVEKTYSKSNNYMQLTLKNKDIKSGDIASFQLQATEPLDIIRYEIISRGSITKIGTLSGNRQSIFSFDIEMTADMGPVANLITYYVRDDAEMVADSIAFNVDGVFKNKVTVDFSAEKAEPNTNIQLKVSADPMSKVYLLAVDESVLLLKSGNDISTSKVESQISKDQQPLDSEFALSHSAVNVGEVFQKAGLMYITDATIPGKRPPSQPGQVYMSGRRSKMRGYPPGPRSFDIGEGGIAYGSISPPQSANSLASVKRIRKVFPEAWLWTDLFTNADGSTVVNTTVPDTITTWVASAFATNQRTGLGVAATKANMTVFRSFFVSLTYPQSLKRNEQAVIQATVFNYMQSNVFVTVTLKNTGGFQHVKIMGNEETVTGNSQPQRIQVEANSHGVAYFGIVAKEIGVFDIEVRAQTTLAADGVRRQIAIEPEGAPATYNIPIFVDGRSVHYNERHTFTFPEATVPGSERISVGVSGDLIGPSLDNVDSLLSIPTGCGEQNMVRFAPNLYIAKYLKATGQLMNNKEKEIVDNLSSGYQRELNYRRSDASFSAFGNNDESGSTWLTAYVSRAFSEAREFIYIDPDIITKAIDWLIQRQRDDGAFVELGRVIDPNTQGKSTGPALTAYSLLSLIETKDLVSLEGCDPQNNSFKCFRAKRWMNATRKATLYLERNLGGISDPFSLSVVTYALTEARSGKSQRALRKLKKISISEGGLIYWNGTSKPKSSPAVTYRTIWRPPHVQSRPINILITAYSLLAYTARGQIRQSIPVVRWLASQRNTLGGFSSTQDTTVALQALSAYATRSYRPNSKLSLGFEMDGGENMRFDISHHNMLNYQKKEFEQKTSNDPSQRYNVDVTALGNGLALAEISFKCHLDTVKPSDSFDVSTVLLDDDLDNFNLMICTKWLKDEKTGMVVQEIEIPSGFEPDMTSIGNVAGMKRYERKGNVVAVYFEEIIKTSICYSMIMSRRSKVAKSEKSFVHTFNYYSPEDQSTVFYQPRKLRESKICDVCPRCCH